MICLIVKGELSSKNNLYPKHGWCTFCLQDDTQTFAIAPSYLTDVMFDTLYAIQSYLSSGISVVKYDCEKYGKIIFIIDHSAKGSHKKLEHYAKYLGVEYEQLKTNITNILTERNQL